MRGSTDLDEKFSREAAEAQRKKDCHPRRARDPRARLRGPRRFGWVRLSKKIVITGLVPVIHFPETVHNFVGLWKMDGRHNGAAMTNFL